MASLADGKACLICGERHALMNSHHTIPRSRGGENSLQIPLCCTDHDLLHANALAIVAKLKGSKKAIKNFWSTPDKRERAKPWLEILVKALLQPVDPSYEAQHPIHLKVDTPFLEMMKLLQQDLGASSMEKTIRFALETSIAQRGLGNVIKNAAVKQRAKLWFMRRPE